MHPSHSGISTMLGLDEAEILRQVKCPQMFFAAGDDNENVKPGGLGEKILGSQLEIVEFPEMKHGWTTKGDLSRPEVERDTKKAFNLVISYFGKYFTS